MDNTGNIQAFYVQNMSDALIVYIDISNFHGINGSQPNFNNNETNQNKNAVFKLVPLLGEPQSRSNIACRKELCENFEFDVVEDMMITIVENKAGLEFDRDRIGVRINGQAAVMSSLPSASPIVLDRDQSSMNTMHNIEDTNMEWESGIAKGNYNIQ